MRLEILALALIGPLGGCASDVPTIGMFAFNSLSWLGLRPAPEPAVAGGPPAEQAALYCYSTLADKDCHARALPTAESTRLVGHVEPTQKP